MNIVTIDGITYDVFVTDVSEDFSILYSENTGRTMSQGARMTLDPLGTFFAHKVTFACKTGKETEFDALYTYLSKPRINGVRLKIVHDQSDLTYDAYVSSGGRSVKRIDAKKGKIYWDVFSANFVPMEAQVIFGE